MTFREFYPLYLAGHRHPLNRAIHYVGACSALLGLAVAILQARPWIMVATAMSVYGVLWISHFLIEGNVPVTLKGGWRMVVLSFCGEFYMTWRFITGRLGADLDQYQLR